jgi:hypothetical protein
VKPPAIGMCLESSLREADYSSEESTKSYNKLTSESPSHWYVSGILIT